MSSSDYKRPDGVFRFDFGGVNTKDAPDAIGDGKYSIAQNVRATGAHEIRGRPGYVAAFVTANNAITDIRAYTRLQTDSLPRLLARGNDGRIYLDTGVNVGNLNGNAGYGASMVPFRPNESSVPWMYIGGLNDYQRFSAPDANNNVTQAKVGIAEPQLQVEAAVTRPNINFNLGRNANTWTPAGNNSSGTSNYTRHADNINVSAADPVNPGIISFSPDSANNYSLFELLTSFNNATAVVQDVISPIAASNNLQIASIYYPDGGNNGNAVVVLGQTPLQSNVGDPIAGLRRGALVTNTSANETVLVLDVIPGPNGVVAFECTTVGTWANNQNVTGIPTIVVASVPGDFIGPGGTVGGVAVACNLNAGVTTFSQNFGTAFASINGRMPQTEDYFHVSLRLDDWTKLNQILLLFSLDGGNNFTGNVLYYSIRQGDLVNILSGNQTQLPAILASAEAQLIAQLPTPENLTPPAQSIAGANQWSEIIFPISALTRLGSDQGKSLADCTQMRISVNVSNATTVYFGSLWAGAGNAPDVGNNGVAYKYYCVPMNSNTGVRGNPTPPMRYGVSPRRQAVLLNTANLNANYDPQIDTWEVYRYGGSITSSRAIGSTPVGNNYTDVIFDDAAAAGSLMPIDNTEPWPTIDVPWRVTANNANITAYGQYLVVTGNNSLFPATVTRWLPGTIFQIGGTDAYVLRSRPVAVASGYRFEFEQAIGSGNQTPVFVLEPNIAHQPLPYVWGPNEEGYFFGCGDTFRPSVISYCKAYTPDSVPTKFNLELCPPSEPMLGGEIIRGVSLAASSLRWWFLNYQRGNARELYAKVEAPVGKRLASPYGKCTDGAQLYFWAPDCIAKTDGGPAKSLTDEDLFNIFPHGDIKGIDVTRGPVTFYAPDYTRVAQFRLAVKDGAFLHALYRDLNGIPRVIVCNLQTGAWSTDTYADAMTAMYAVEQPQGPLTGSGNAYPSLIMGDSNGNVWTAKDYTNDRGNSNGVPISCVVGTREWNGGDLRADNLWGDLFLDLFAPNGAIATPTANSNPIGGNTNVVADGRRQQVQISLGGSTLQSYLGLQVAWSDDYGSRNQTGPSTLYAWQPSYVSKPEVIRDRDGDIVDFGKAMYVRGVNVYADTSGQNKLISIQNFDANNNNGLYVPLLGGPAPGVINHNGEQIISYYFNPPFVSHMVRDVTYDAVPWRRFWFKYMADEWPELTDIASPWIKLMPDGGAAFFQGLVVPLETGGRGVPQLRVRTDIGNNNTIALIANTNPDLNIKTGVPYSLATPVIAHHVQIVPQQPCRVWWDECQWIAQPTPELANTWKTQATAFGSSGYKHCPLAEFAYRSTADITVTATVFDGTSPQSITLPASGGQTRRYLFNFTLNKGQLYTFSATSADPFQIFEEDSYVMMCPWGRESAGVKYNLLGHTFGDKATI